VRLKVKGVQKGGKEHTVPIYRFTGDRDGGTARESGDYLFDMPVQEDITVLELKMRLAEKMREAGTAEADGSCLRVREMGYSVFMDAQTVCLWLVGDAMGHLQRCKRH
jgi:hypothetical protein